MRRDGNDDPPRPYKVTPVFDETSLPQALRSEHSTKAGVWGIIRVLEGRLRYVIPDSLQEQVLTPGRSGVVVPAQRHFVEPLGVVRVQVEFYRQRPVR